MSGRTRTERVEGHSTEEMKQPQRHNARVQARLCKISFFKQRQKCLAFSKDEIALLEKSVSTMVQRKARTSPPSLQEPHKLVIGACARAAQARAFSAGFWRRVTQKTQLTKNSQFFRPSTTRKMTSDTQSSPDHDTVPALQSSIQQSTTSPSIPRPASFC